MRFRLAILLLACAVFGGLLVTPATSGAPRQRPPTPKLHEQLQELKADPRAGPEDGVSRSVMRRGGLVTVAALPAGDVATLHQDLLDLGLRDGGRTVGMVTGRLPLSALDEAERLASLGHMRPDWVMTRTGSVDGLGDDAMRADLVRTQAGLTGQGVKVGSLSDSYDSGAGAAADVSSGDLPSGVVVLEDGGGWDEGRAMMQLIHDTAPGAQQLFRTAAGGQADFAQGIRDLANAGAKVVNDDIFYLAEPWFQDGVIARAIDEVTAQGVTYFSAAGNDADDSYEAPFRSSGQAGPSGDLHDFDDGPGLDTAQRITVPADSWVDILLQWDDPFSTHGPVGPSSDLDLYITNATGAHVASSTSNNGSEALEIVTFYSGSSAADFDVKIDHVDGPAPGVIKWIALGVGRTFAVEYDTQSSTVYAHPNALGAIAVGAAFYQETPRFGQDPPLAEWFSARGGLDVLFGADGQRLPEPSGRLKPDIMAPDGTNTTFFGSDTIRDDDTLPNFFGTSAAAPHAAGVAALLLQAQPASTPASIRTALGATAVDMDVAGFDLRTGFGLVDAEAALQHIGGSAPTPVVSIVRKVKRQEGAKFAFRVTLDVAPTQVTTVRFRTVNGTARAPSDYRAVSGTLRFQPGQRAKTIVVRSVEDRRREPHERFNVRLSVPNGAVIGRGTGVGWIINDD